MMTDHTIDDSFVGQAIGPVDGGYLVTFRQTKNQTSYVVPDWDEGRMVWKSGYFVLKGSRDLQAVYSDSPGQGGSVDPQKVWVVNASFRYHGQLIVVARPRGSEWAVTLSDIPNPHEAPAAWPTWAPISRERELVAR
jgi:hypothetical protein